jgi:hypothetical protein
MSLTRWRISSFVDMRIESTLFVELITRQCPLITTGGDTNCYEHWKLFYTTEGDKEQADAEPSSIASQQQSPAPAVAAASALFAEGCVEAEGYQRECLYDEEYFRHGEYPDVINITSK